MADTKRETWAEYCKALGGRILELNGLKGPVEPSVFASIKFDVMNDAEKAEWERRRVAAEAFGS